MASFLLVQTKHKNSDDCYPTLIRSDELGAALPVTRGDMAGIGSWLYVPEYIIPTCKLLIWGTPSDVAEAIASDGQVASLVPVEDKEFSA